MALLDIPMRDDQDGETQAILFKSYIKDLTLSDIIVEGLLTAQNPVDAWRGYSNSEEGEIPFSYDLSQVPLSFISKVRMTTGDIDVTDIKFTDVEIMKALEYLPLKYLIMAINSYLADGSTYPDNTNHPVRIIRDLLADQSGALYTDVQLISMMLDYGRNPYQAVVGMIESEGSVEAAHDARQFNGGLASIDGISFDKKGKGEDTLSMSNVAIVFHKMQNSVYAKGNGLYSHWNGTKSSNTILRGGWYAL